MFTPNNDSVDALRQLKPMTAPSAQIELLNIAQVTGLMRVSHATVYRLVHRRVIPVYRACRHLRFNKHDVLKYLLDNRSDRS